jgi:hypothetical protein
MKMNGPASATQSILLGPIPSGYCLWRNVAGVFRMRNAGNLPGLSAWGR